MSNFADGLNEQAMALNEAEEPIKTVRPRYAYFDKGQTVRGERSRMKLINPSTSNEPDSFDELRKWNVWYDLNESETGFVNFFLQRVALNLSEKTQVTQTFGGADVVYYFGQSPIVFQLGGMLFDDVDNGWFVDFMMAYSEMLRGTQTAKRQQLVQIDLPSMTIIGTITGCSVNQDSSRDTDIPFNIQVLAQRVFYKPFSKDGKAMALSSETLPTVTLDNNIGSIPTNTQEAINAIKDGEGNTLGTYTGYSNAFSTSLTQASSFLDELTGEVNDIGNFVSGYLTEALSPINQILTQIRDISDSAAGLARGVETSVQNIINVPMRLLYNAERTEDSLRNTIGIVTYLPESISDRVSRFIKDGVLNGTTAILSGVQASPEETAAILSARPYRVGDAIARLQDGE